MVIGACPYPCPPSSVTHANQPPSLWHRPSHSRHPLLLSPCLSFRLPMRKGPAPKRDPSPCHFTSEQVWSSLSHICSLHCLSFPSHRRSYPRCRIGGNLTKALFDRVSLRVVYLRGATSHILILSLLNLRDELIIQPCPHPPSARRCSLARGRQPARDT